MSDKNPTHQHPLKGFSTAYTLGAITLLLAPIGFFCLFSRFLSYDDEGLFLVTIRDFLAGQADYSQIYGPFFYETMTGIFRLFSLTVSTDNARLITLAFWLLASLLSALTTLALTHKLLLAVAAQLISFLTLASLMNEPLHPQGLVSVLLVSLTLLAILRLKIPRTSAFGLGALAVALLLTKVNLGVFAWGAIAFTFAFTWRSRWKFLVLPAAILAMLAAPFLLTSGLLLSLTWVFSLALVISLSLASISLISLRSPLPQLPRTFIGNFLIGAAILAIAVTCLAIENGLHLSDLKAFQANVLNQGTAFALPVPVTYLHVAWAAICLGAVAILSRFSKTLSVPAIVRILAGAFIALTILILPANFFFAALPLTALVVLPPPSGNSSNSIDPFARTFIAVLAIIETLQIYPVAGSQLSIAELSFIPLAAVIFNDGRQQQHTLATTKFLRRRLAHAVDPIILGACLAPCLLLAYLSMLFYFSGSPLDLEGTQLMRLAPSQSTNLKALSEAIDQNCNNFVTLPRMSSLYIWTKQKGYSQLNDGVWMFTASNNTQQQVVSQIQSQQRVCIVRNRSVMLFWAQGRPIPDGPLITYINNNFTTIQTFGDYELMVRQ